MNAEQAVSELEYFLSRARVKLFGVDGRVSDALQLLKEEARAAWSMRVLDAWADANPYWAEWTYSRRGVHGVQLLACFFEPRMFMLSDYGTMAAARLAAADAVFETLPEAERKRIGVRP